MENVIDLLQARGFIEDCTSIEVKQLANQPLKIYVGFDPSSDSLHLGNFIPIMGLAWFRKFGHTPVVLVGGATGMIGDPSGKLAERNLLDKATIQVNVEGIKKDLESVLRNVPGPAPLFVNNLDWFEAFSFIEFLRDIGKFFRMGPMLGKESVKKRLESEEGLSFTEFCYQTMQGYDFLYLYQHHGVKVQMGGSDQWGNITAGTELIRKVTGHTSYGITFPLLLKSDGQKFGKSEKGSIWLSPDKLSPYEFYQQLYRTADADVVKLLKMLTFLPLDEIRALEREMKEPGYVPNKAQKILASLTTEIVHGNDSLQKALQASAAMAPGSKQAPIDLAALEAAGSELPSAVFSREEVEGKKLIDLLILVKLLPSKSEARRMIKNGGVYLNNESIADENRIIGQEDCIDAQALLLAAGKKHKFLLKIKS